MDSLGSYSSLLLNANNLFSTLLKNINLLYAFLTVKRQAYTDKNKRDIS